MNAKIRQLTSVESEIVERLLRENFPGNTDLLEQLRGALVTQIDSNGSLQFHVQPPHKAAVKGRVPVEAEYEDSDGTTVHVLLHVVDGSLNELELFKEDNSPISKAPDPSSFRVMTL